MNNKLIQAYEAVSNPEASLLRKAEGYDLLLRELLNIKVDEHKNVCSPIVRKAGDLKFLQSLCTRFSKLMATKAEGDGDGENSGNEGESANTDKRTNEMPKRFKESGKSIEDFI